MLFGYLTLATALIISLSAEVYSILGLIAIFAAAPVPVAIMGGSLGVGKIVTTLWLHKYWTKAELQYKVYLCSAVAILMLLTSMGVFGFLSKAHSDQSLVSGDVGAKIAVYDEKIKIEKDNVDANRRALKQMDEAVDQVMARSTSEGGADKAVAIRRSQQKERARLLSEIADSQKKITSYNEERAPIAAEVRKVDAEVGPIKYIAALIYGDNADDNVLEKSVRWVIILIVIVFDPLALTLLLAATKALEWERGIDLFNPKKRDEEDNAVRYNSKDNTWSNVDQPKVEPIIAQEVADIFPDLVEEEPVPAKKNKVLAGLDSMWDNAKRIIKRDEEAEHAPIEVIEDLVIDDDHEEIDAEEKEARRAWKEANPRDTIKRHRKLYDDGLTDNLPWMHPDYYPGLQTQLGLAADNVPTGNAGEMKGFGTSFPTDPKKSDMFLRVDQLPSALYKFNGSQWIEVDKSLSDQHAYDEAYIDHLIEKISTGEYDPELLSDAERNSIEQRLNTKPKQA